MLPPVHTRRVVLPFSDVCERLFASSLFSRCSIRTAVLATERREVVGGGEHSKQLQGGEGAKPRLGAPRDRSHSRRERSIRPGKD